MSILLEYRGSFKRCTIASCKSPFYNRGDRFHNYFELYF